MEKRFKKYIHVIGLIICEICNKADTDFLCDAGDNLIQMWHDGDTDKTICNKCKKLTERKKIYE